MKHEIDPCLIFLDPFFNPVCEYMDRVGHPEDREFFVRFHLLVSYDLIDRADELMKDEAADAYGFYLEAYPDGEWTLLIWTNEDEYTQAMISIANTEEIYWRVDSQAREYFEYSMEELMEKAKSAP